MALLRFPLWAPFDGYNMNAVEMSLFTHRLASICDEMGATLKRSALSPNIKDREDFSCALFNAEGELVAQAAHIPVHLGSMAYAMHDVVSRFNWQDGDEVVFNDPFLGGTHLPDITVVQPVFAKNTLLGFVASRAHHADVGGEQPGSMGICRTLQEEGVVLSPELWKRAGKEDKQLLQNFLSRARDPGERLGDLAAQRAACTIGAQRLKDFHCEIDVASGFAGLLSISEAYGSETIASMPDGNYHFEDMLEDDGLGGGPFLIRVAIGVKGKTVKVDFSGTARQCSGPMNCPLPVTAAAVFYAFRCLMPSYTPQTSAVFRPINIEAPPGCLVNARAGAAVAAGNVETSQRIVDVTLGALALALPERIPAASQGTMNNILFGGRFSDGHDWVYYETIGGGMGASRKSQGLSGVQCHMTNTKNTSIEVVEMHYPIRIRRYALRHGSGGSGLQCGGDGLIREWQASSPCTVSLLTERRSSRPFGLAGGEAGLAGENTLLSHDVEKVLPAKCVLELDSGDILRIKTPGGGGFGPAGGEAK